jgi:hypothetical protein
LARIRLARTFADFDVATSEDFRIIRKGERAQIGHVDCASGQFAGTGMAAEIGQQFGFHDATLFVSQLDAERIRIVEFRRGVSVAVAHLEVHPAGRILNADQQRQRVPYADS